MSNKLICTTCNADLTKPKSVSRDYIMSGHYDENGNFNPTGSLEIVETPDLCLDCLEEI